MLMEYVAMIRQGWPNGSALDRAEVIHAGSTLQNGDWVQKQSDGTVALSGATAADAVGLVVSGNGDSASAANSGKAVVLWSGFIADISNYDPAPTYAPGSPLTAKNGILTLAAVATGTGSTYVPGDPVIAKVLNVTAASTTPVANTAHLTIVVK